MNICVAERTKKRGGKEKGRRLKTRMGVDGRFLVLCLFDSRLELRLGVCGVVVVRRSVCEECWKRIERGRGTTGVFFC